MAHNIIAALAGFLLVALAAMFGMALSPDQSNVAETAAAIAMFVAGTSLGLGATFGRPGTRAVTISACVALLIMWLGMVLGSMIGDVSLEQIEFSVLWLIGLSAVVGAFSVVGARIHIKLAALPWRRG
jgi:uncharacterized membrane protein